MRGVGLRRSRGGGRDDLPLTADINVTSLVDVAFTLLVIFIITAPILQGGIEVDLPQGEVRPVTAMEDLFIITVTRDGDLFLEEMQVPWDDFESSFAQLIEAGDIEQVYIKGDTAVSYGPMFRVVQTVGRAGVPMALIGEVPPVQRR